MKSITDGKPIETYVLHELAGRNELEKCYALEADAYQKEIETLKADVNIMRQKEVSRGEIERAERLNKGKVIKAISNNLKGKFNGKAEYLYNTSKNYNVNPMLVAAICYHETGNGSSEMCVKRNNPGGITTNNGFAKYQTLENGIDAMCRLLKENYIDEGLTDISSIGKKYCPIGASNDPSGLNKYWIPLVTKTYQKILDEAK